MGTAGRIGSFTRDRAIWPVLLSLVLLVVAPAACIIWFMTEAAGNQADAARQRLSEALGGQLRLLRDRVEADWRARVASLGVIDGSGAAAFKNAVLSRRVDAIVFVGKDAAPIYPTTAASPARTVDPSQDSDWLKAETLELQGDYPAAARVYAELASRERTPARGARAAQAHVRMLARSRDTDGALRAIDEYFSSGRFASGRDAHGRLIAADARLLALRLLTPQDTRFPRAADRLAGILRDYEGTAMPSTQRLFLMSELIRIAGPDVEPPTYAAERLAAEFVEADGRPPSSEWLEATRVPDVWKLSVSRGSAIALFRTGTVTGMADAVLKPQSEASGARFTMVPPGRDGGADAIAASPLLPGWLLGFSLVDADRVEAAAGRRMATYLWAGSLAVAGLAVAGLLLGQAFRRQLRLNRLKTDLVAAVSHELKTPLASVRALVDLMLDDPDIDRSRRREYLQMIAEENARLSRLIEHFLTFSRVDRNGQRLVFRDVHPEALVSQAVATVPGQERFPGLAIAVSPDLPPLYGDEDALVTVLLNLLENAFKYTRENKRVSLRVFEDAGRVAFEVEDNGIGISRRDRKRIFQPFYQVDQRLARESGGCGLGLSIVEFIVRAHGGEVSVRSEPGAGSQFTVLLPSRAAARRAVA
jgi:signal transduction histidine kinase